MIDRRTFLVVALGVLVLPLPGEAQQAGKIYRIGLLGHGLSHNYVARFKAFRQELSARGYVDGRNIHYEYRYAGGRVDRLPALAADLVRLKCDVIVSTSTPTTRAVMEAGPDIPIVMNSASPVETGLVTSLARPGGNVTGVTVTVGPAFRAQHLELLKELAPSARHVAIIWQPSNASQRFQLKPLQIAAATLGMTLHPVSAEGKDDILAKIDQERPDALTAFGASVANDELRRRILDFAAQNRIPAAWPSSAWMKLGGLMALTVNFTDLARRKAIYVDRILKGAKPADLPVERPTKFDLIINLKTAKVLGLTIPPSLMLRADEVIQ